MDYNDYEEIISYYEVKKIIYYPEFYVRKSSQFDFYDVTKRFS